MSKMSDRSTMVRSLTVLHCTPLPLAVPVAATRGRKGDHSTAKSAPAEGCIDTSERVCREENILKQPSAPADANTWL